MATILPFRRPRRPINVADAFGVCFEACSQLPLEDGARVARWLHEKFDDDLQRAMHAVSDHCMYPDETMSPEEQERADATWRRTWRDNN